MKLPRGITGLWSTNDGLGVGKFSVSVLRDSLYPAEYSRAYKIQDFKKDMGCQSYYRFSVVDRLKDSTFDILVHSSYPYYCGVLSDTTDFIDLPDAITSIAHPDFTYLLAAELSARYSDSDLEELSETERKAIRYWKPGTIGGIIFNYFD